MALRKTAIALPEEVIEGVDRAARERGESRSRFICRVVQAALRARRDAAITRRLDEIFGDEEVVKEQVRGARELEAAGIAWEREAW